MQTDFRQERRWKVVTAYTIARDCRAYVRASPSDRSKLVVPTRPPRTLTDSEIEARMTGPPTSGESLSAGAEDLESATLGRDAEKDKDSNVDEDDQDAEGEPDDDAGVRVVAASASDAVKDAVPVASAPAGAGKAGGSAGDEATVTAAAPSSRSQAEANKAHSQAQHIQNLITFRNPIFDASVADTTISSSDLAFIRDSAATAEKAKSTEDDPFLGYDFAVLFPDLPLYSDFAIANDPSLARRVEDSSAWSGRLAQVTRLLEIKPTLVSTLQPGRTRTDKGWSPALIDALEDVKDSMSPGETPVPASASTLFAGRKPKDVATGELLVKPQEVPNAEIRATAILWLPEEDALLLALQKQYGLNWSLIAQIFNSTTHRPESDYRLAWDVYDRWDKLVGPGSKKLLPDGTEIVRPPPEWLPPVDRTGRPMPVIADGSKKKTRHAMIVEAMKKVQKKRELYASKQPGKPRAVSPSRRRVLTGDVFAQRPVSLAGSIWPCTNRTTSRRDRTGRRWNGASTRQSRRRRSCGCDSSSRRKSKPRPPCVSNRLSRTPPDCSNPDHRRRCRLKSPPPTPPREHHRQGLPLRFPVRQTPDIARPRRETRLSSSAATYRISSRNSPRISLRRCRRASGSFCRRRRRQ